MEAKELMCGDLLHIHNGYLREVCKVIDVFERDIRVISNASVFDDAIDYCTPIPLTNGIMEANGFVKFNVGNPLSMYWKLDGLYVLVSVFNYAPDGKHFSGEWSVDYNEQRTPRYGVFSCQYVHELQHLLRVAGFNKLAGDFKIK